MNILRAYLITLTMLAGTMAGVRHVEAQCSCADCSGGQVGGLGILPQGAGGAVFPGINPTPGYHPAALMMGQEPPFDPTAAFANGSGCCGPNWYDFLIESVYMKRDDAGRTVPYTSDGIAGAGPPNLVLTSDDLDFDFDLGLRAAVRYQLGAVYNVEIGFLGALDWRAFDQATSNSDSLYSSFSDFGNTPFGGFDDVDQASLHSTNYRSDLDTVEINMRRSWASSTNRFHGSWLAGVRYLRLNERFQFHATVNPHFDPINNVDRDAAVTDYSIRTDNDLVGLQMGGQIGFCLLAGINWTTEFKAGAYSNESDQNSVLSSTTVVPALLETANSEDIALIAEFGTNLIYHLHPMVKIRAGYQALFVDGVALATENFNSQPPFLGLTRTPTINDNGNLFFHGGALGLEIGW